MFSHSLPLSAKTTRQNSLCFAPSFIFSFHILESTVSIHVVQLPFALLEYREYRKDY